MRYEERGEGYRDVEKVGRHCCRVSVGPSHHGMARPQLADGGTACNMEGSCVYIE